MNVKLKVYGDTMVKTALNAPKVYTTVYKFAIKTIMSIANRFTLWQTHIRPTIHVLVYIVVVK